MASMVAKEAPSSLRELAFYRYQRFTRNQQDRERLPIACPIYGSLPPVIREADSAELFKAKRKTYIDSPLFGT